MDVDCTRNVLGLVLVNSGDYAHGGGFGSPSPETLAFLKALPERIGAKSMVFQHMPLPEYYQVLRPVAANAAFAMQGYREHADTYYVLDEDRTKPAGIWGRASPARMSRTSLRRCARGISVWRRAMTIATDS